MPHNEKTVHSQNLYRRRLESLRQRFQTRQFELLDLSGFESDYRAIVGKAIAKQYRPLIKAQRQALHREYSPLWQHLNKTHRLQTRAFLANERSLLGRLRNAAAYFSHPSQARMPLLQRLAESAIPSQRQQAMLLAHASQRRALHDEYYAKLNTALGAIREKARFDRQQAFDDIHARSIKRQIRMRQLARKSEAIQTYLNNGGTWPTANAFRRFPQTSTTSPLTPKQEPDNEHEMD